MDDNTMDLDSKAEDEAEVINVMSGQSFIMDDSTVLAPVEIEVLDPTSIDNIDMGEFVEAQAITIHQIPNELAADSVKIIDCTQPEESDVEDMSVLTAEEENLLTKQFLNGELTFSEFTERVDRDTDAEGEETETRNISESQSTVDSANQNDKKKIDKISKSKPRRTRRNLPAALQGLMGEANLRYARGEIELATQMCYEIIRQVPNAPEPFHTLSMIYENDQPDKSLQFALIAAHLSPRDSDQWVRLANSSLESGNLRQALTCYSKAIQASPKDIELYETRAKLQDENGDRKAYIRAYSKLVHNLGPEDGFNIIKYAKLLAKRCMQENMYETALEGMDNIFKKCPQLVTLEEVNIMTELLIFLKQFTRCLEILTKHTNIWIEYVPLNDSQETDKTKSSTIALCNIPDDLAVDLKAKCIISLIELDEISIADTLVPKFQLLENPEISGDLYLDVAEAFMSKKHYERAMKLLEPLVNSENFSLAAVWLRHAECWVGCNELSKAIKSYEVVRKLSPQHLGARMELAKLYRMKCQFSKAIQVLKQDPETDVLDPGVVYERTKLLLKVKRYGEFFQSGLLLLSRHCVTLRSKLELTALSRTSGVRQRMEILQRDRLSRGESLNDENPPMFSSHNEPTTKQEFLLVLQMARLACKLKKYGLMQRICFTALTSKRFAQENSHIMFLCLISCIRNNDSYDGFNVVRELVRSKKRSKSWNLLNVIIQKAEDSRHNRFMMRQLGKEDAFSYLHILHANNCLVSGTYKYALNDYTSLFKVQPSALLAMLIAITLLQMACQKFSAKKNQLVTQSLAFLKTYVKLRGEQGSQEAHYNTARALHQLGLLPGAIHFYKRVLEMPAPQIVQENSALLDLKKEAAFNLHLIYAQADNTQLARITMAATLDSKIMFQCLCSLFEKISKAKGAQKVQELQMFTRECVVLANKLKVQNPEADVSLFPIFRLILPSLERDRGPYGLQNKTLAALYKRVFYLGKNSASADKLTNFRKPGACGSSKSDDLAESVYWLMKNRMPNSSALSVQHINEFLDNIAACHEENRSKDEHFRHLFNKVNAMELKWITRLLLKELKLGLAQKKVFGVLHPDAEAQFNVSSSLRRVCEKYSGNVEETSDFTDGENSDRVSIQLFSHVKPMLLERFKFENVASLFASGQQLYYVQTKFDGERSQVHFKEGHFKYFTRKGYDITKNASYGETPESGGFLSRNIAPQLNPSCISVILDGEMMGWHKERKVFGTKALNYDVKKLSENSKHQPCFVAYDILWYNDESLLNKTYTERLSYLSTAFTEKEGVIMHCNMQTVTDSDKLVEIFNLALDKEDEGIVVKRSDALYLPNVRERSGCYKIKAEYSDALVNDLDLLILGGYYGQGRCSGIVSSFLVGVAEPATNKNGMPSVFHAIVRVRSGVSDNQLQDIQKKCKPYWKDKRPAGVSGPKLELPDLWISPKHSIVLQLRASEIIRSKSYPIGYTMRFPRVMKIRYDKSWYDTCSTIEFKSLVKNKGFVQKLTKRRAVISDINEIPEDDEEEKLQAPKIRKTKSHTVSKKASVSVYGSLANNIDTDDVQRLSRLFDGKEFCVINGDSEMNREVAIKLLKQHSAKVAQNASKDTFCVLVGDPSTLKAQNVITRAHHDVVNLDWLRRATKFENLGKLQDYRPWELHAASVSTKRKMSDLFDAYWDSFTEASNEKDLQRVLKKIEESTVNEKKTSIADMKKMDKLLYDGVSPFSVFRGAVAYFGNKEDIEKFPFAYMSGKIVEELDETVTHAFEPINESMQQLCIEKCIPVLKSKWIEDCFQSQRLLSFDDYVV